ncbi:MAG: hypothetical protein ACHQTE_00405 [Candidatus Saccharimonadales bacterium]
MRHYYKTIGRPDTFVFISALFIIVLVALRLVILPVSPPGFYLDEAAGGAQIVAMLHHGANVHGQAWPLFSASLGGGYTTPIYLYPATLWAALFGTSELALRYFSQFMTLLAIVMIALATRYWLGQRAALISTIVGLALPWSWLQGSLAWDPALVPFFVAAAYLTSTLLFFSHSPVTKICAAVLLPVSLVGLAYLYPPCRVTAPLLYVLLYGLLYYKKALSLRVMISSLIGTIVIALPLALFILQPDAMERSKVLSVFYGVPIWQGLWQLLINFSRLLNPVFLFVYGDPNLRHSTGWQGMLGLAAIPPTLALLYVFFQRPFARIHFDKTMLLIIIALGGIVCSLLGSALTNEGQPQSLRATAAWPFFVILLTIGWHVILTRTSRTAASIIVSICLVCTVSYAVDLAFFYPKRASQAFDAPARRIIFTSHTNAPGYPDLSYRYYTTR